ncbi:hypothetical protein [Bifidobacterium leontopitheci]|uniref:Uncharacterized protein n=1 Tax=Bifidobacterium leontopitheci TaxID=2650774 RepID=A0A6I1GTF8_9BIFI|nr:hypothetical protein [Bifidobacterium leontopitheci]KAB7791478.1 hypothetical protein F7D09_0153 [Bifidobacterium leontopitheci]
MNRIKRKRVAICSAVLACALAVVPSVPALAASGRIDGADVKGSWVYTWTYSYAEGSSASRCIYVWVKQDGAEKSGKAKYPRQWIDVEIRGHEYDVDDGARVNAVNCS